MWSYVIHIGRRRYYSCLAALYAQRMIAQPRRRRLAPRPTVATFASTSSVPIAAIASLPWLMSRRCGWHYGVPSTSGSAYVDPLPVVKSTHSPLPRLALYDVDLTRLIVSNPVDALLVPVNVVVL